MSHGRIDNRYLVVATILGLAAIGAFTTMAMTIGEDFAIPALIALGVVGAVIFKGPVGKALGRRLENGRPGGPVAGAHGGHGRIAGTGDGAGGKARLHRTHAQQGTRARADQRARLKASGVHG